MAKNNELDMLNGALLPKILMFSLPLALTGILQLLFNAADVIVVGAPYWDLTFPAALKVYLEWACTLGITFGYTQAGEQRGLCRAERLIYITTAGGPLEDRNFGYEYVRGVAGMLGIINTHCVAAQGLDIRGNDPEAILREAQERAARTYLDRRQWNQMALINIARSGVFAADRSIANYADTIWHVPYKK